MKFLFLATSCAFWSTVCAAETFTLHEVFGVSHPRQIVDFDFHSNIDPATAYVTGPEGKPVSFQILRGKKLAVETDLPAFGERTWNLRSGHAPQIPAAGVHIDTTPGWYEITNGLTGIRITREGLAPVQGVRYRDGVWTGTGPNYLFDGKDKRLAPKSFTVRFLEKGPLKVVMEAAYTFDKPELVSGATHLLPAGPGFYRCTIEVQADQPSILLEEDTDFDLRYQFAVSPGLDPDQARYRGHHSTSIAHGYQADGKIYPGADNGPQQDIFRNLRFDPPAPSCYGNDDPCIARMSAWDPWSIDTGYYWELYKTGAGPGANLFGIFAGRPSEAIGAAHNGAGVYTGPNRTTGIRVEIDRRNPDNQVFPRVRFAWGIFTGTKGEDLGDPLQAQNINRQMNLQGGFNLNKVYRYQGTAGAGASDPGAQIASAARPLYMSAAGVRTIASAVESDEVKYRYFYDAEPSARELLEFWRKPGTAGRQKIVGSISLLAHDLLDALVNGAGIYDFQFHYWHGGLAMSRKALWINTVLNAPEATAGDRTTVLAAAGLFAGVLWDDDFVPMQDGAGLNLGTANMPVQQSEYRNLYALMLSDSPAMRGRARAAVNGSLANLHNTVNDHGAHMGSTHYIGASMGPLLSSLQQIQMASGLSSSGPAAGFRVSDPFRTEPRLAAFAEFFMNLLTPAEVRFGGWRKIVCFGDSSTESSELTGQLATGFASVNPDLSARLMWVWNHSGAPQSGFHGTTLLKIDTTLPAKDPELGDASFPGVYTVLRNEWRTRDETALWFVNGDYYRDHIHEDNGNIAIYALGAPLSLDWMSLYNPPASGAFMHNAPIPESRLKFAWNDGQKHLDILGFRWSGAVQEAFESTPSGSYARAAFYLKDNLTWRRSVYSLHSDPGHPILIVHDKFYGPGAGSPKILSLNLMAREKVDTSAPGRFGFTGQFLIDFDVYVLQTAPVETFVDGWEHHEAPNREQMEFRAANNGRPFGESQRILRLRSEGEFLLVLLPRRKGDMRRPSVVRRGSSVVVQADGEDPVTVGLK